MKTVKLRKFLIFGLILATTLMPAFAYDSEKTVRVGISDANFSKYLYPEIRLYSTGLLTVSDGNSVLAKDVDSVRITLKNGQYKVFTPSGNAKISCAGTLKITNNGLLGVYSLKRAGVKAQYRGDFELVKHENTDTFALVNVLSLKDYLKGVVPNEMPVSFGLEALKAQCTAARNYALRPRVTYYKEFDVCDSVACQVYFGANTEKKLANRAVEETDGLVTLYDGHLILALYSSTSGGYTENYENAFPIKPSDSKHPYLKAVPDKAGLPSLSSEKAAADFYKSRPDSFENNSPLYRWTRSWTYDEFVSMLNKTMLEQASMIKPKFTKDDKFTKLKELKILQRGHSGKIVGIRLITDNGTFDVGKELVIRRVFKKNNAALPSGNFVTEMSKNDETGEITITFVGGGFGHGVGMSQYGAGGMASRGYTFDQILKHYYTDVTIGTMPVTLTYSNPKVVQTYYSPGKKAKIVIDENHGVGQIVIRVNGREVEKEFGFFNRKQVADVSEFVKPGENTIEYVLPEGNAKNSKIVLRAEI